MGIAIASLQLFCCAKSIGVDFSDTITVGRQMMYVSPDVTGSIMGEIGISVEQAVQILEGQFAEPLFALLGAKEVSSVDASDYEHPTFVHDFNLPLPPYLSKRFSVVHDGGTIEHVFNIVQAFKNCMEMVQVGGHFIQVNNANNYMGHGFWQFSPELIYRMFSRENGFHIKAVFLHEHVMRRRGGGASFGTWYKVDDPEVHRRRIELVNSKPTFICTIAQRVEERPIFANAPQQSDYVVAWRRSQTPPEKQKQLNDQGAASIQGFSLRRRIPQPVRNWLYSGRKTAARMWGGPFERRCCRRISDEDLMQGRI